VSISSFDIPLLLIILGLGPLWLLFVFSTVDTKIEKQVLLALGISWTVAITIYENL